MKKAYHHHHQQDHDRRDRVRRALDRRAARTHAPERPPLHPREFRVRRVSVRQARRRYP